MKAIIHINQHKIKSNRKNKSEDPVITVKTYKSNEYAHEVFINGPCKIVYRPNDPLSCGAHVWIEADIKDVSTYVRKQSTDEAH